MVEIPEAWQEDVIYHPVQAALITDNIKRKTIPAGRRSGKTFHFKRFLCQEALTTKGWYFAAAPTRAQAKKIFWEALGELLPKYLQSKPPSLTELIYYLKTGSQIHVIGLDQPARIEGPNWKGGGIDEFGNCKPGTWYEHVGPALETIGLDAWCWIFGVPEGLNDYYDLCEYSKNSNDPDWKNYTWFSSDILPAKTITALKAQYSPKHYRQEWEASFEGATGRVYEDYDKDNHTNIVFDPGKAIHWTHDFNFVPLSSAIIQIHKTKSGADHAYCVDEIVLESAVAKNAAIEFCDKYKGFERVPVYLYGDASGIKGEKHGIESEYITIQKTLQQAGFTVHARYPRSNPAIKDGQNSLRAKILNANMDRSFFVNPAKCKYCDKGLLTVQLKKGSAFQEEESKYQHITTAMRYFTNVKWPIKEVGGVQVVKAVNLT